MALVIIFAVLSQFDFVAKFTVKNLNKDFTNTGRVGGYDPRVWSSSPALRSGSELVLGPHPQRPTRALSWSAASTRPARGVSTVTAGDLVCHVYS